MFGTQRTTSQAGNTDQRSATSKQIQVVETIDQVFHAVAAEKRITDDHWRVGLPRIRQYVVIIYLRLSNIEKIKQKQCSLFYFRCSIMASDESKNSLTFEEIEDSRNLQSWCDSTFDCSFLSTVSDISVSPFRRVPHEPSRPSPASSPAKASSRSLGLGKNASSSKPSAGIGSEVKNKSQSASPRVCHGFDCCPLNLAMI